MDIINLAQIRKNVLVQTESKRKEKKEAYFKSQLP